MYTPLPTALTTRRTASEPEQTRLLLGSDHKCKWQYVPLILRQMLSTPAGCKRFLGISPKTTTTTTTTYLKASSHRRRHDTIQVPPLVEIVAFHDGSAFRNRDRLHHHRFLSYLQSFCCRFRRFARQIRHCASAASSLSERVGFSTKCKLLRTSSSRALKDLPLLHTACCYERGSAVWSARKCGGIKQKNTLGSFAA